MRVILLFLLFVPALASANQLVPKWGFEKNLIARGVGKSDRLWGVEYLFETKSNVVWKLETGTWLTSEEGRRSSFYASPAWGYRVVLDWGPMFETFFGPGYMAKTDSELGGNFQFFHDVNVGIMKDGWGVALGFKHISSAGIFRPNQGRDFLSMRFLINL